MISDAGIELPAMYKLGYMNNNCIGCVKGGIGYWNKIRQDFPEVYERMAKLERELDVAILHYETRGPKRERIRHRMFLDELKPGRGRYGKKHAQAMSCGPICNLVDGS
jgi:hypothetical protein